MSVAATCLDAFRDKIASENINLETARALNRIEPLPTRAYAKLANIAAIASPDMARDLASVVSLTNLDRDSWRHQLVTHQVDLFLVETDYLCPDRWRADLLCGSDRNEIVEVARACRAADIPSALWITLECEQVALVAHLFAAFDFIFVADADAFEHLRASLGAKVQRLLPCVDISRFNPAMTTPQLHGFPRDVMPVVADCLASIMYQDPDGILLNYIQRTMEYKVWLYEGRDLVRPRESYMPAHMLRRSLGTISRDAVASVLKLSDLSLILDHDHRRSYWLSHRKAMEAMASKSLPLSNTIEASVFGSLTPVVQQYLQIQSPDELSEKVAGLLKSRLVREYLQHVFFREVATHHTTDVRIRELLAVVAPALVPPPRWAPLVSAILVTNRPENVAYALARYRSQTYSNKELIIVVNTEETAVEPLRRQLRESDRARIVGVPARWPIGVCLNAGLGLAEGQFWAKIDDDDIYGPNYLADFVIHAGIVDFDIAGKSDVFTYDERDDRTLLRRGSEPFHTPGRSFAGGTLFARNCRELVFNETARGLVDIWFQWEHQAQGRLLYTVEPFNFIQVRRTDRHTHTWRIEVAEMGDAENVGRGLNLDMAFA